jgi:hypothetical protein
MRLSSSSAIDIPIVIPPMNCERAVFALRIRPAAKTPRARAFAHLAGVRVHPHLDEVRSERVLGERLLRCGLVLGVDRHVAARVRTQRAARLDDGRAS